MRLTNTAAEGNSFVIRADDKKVVQNGDRGRDSVRITSHKQYSDSVVVLDIGHMPGGCGQVRDMPSRVV